MDSAMLPSGVNRRVGTSNSVFRATPPPTKPKPLQFSSSPKPSKIDQVEINSSAAILPLKRPVAIATRGSNVNRISRIFENNCVDEILPQPQQPVLKSQVSVPTISDVPSIQAPKYIAVPKSHFEDILIDTDGNIINSESPGIDNSHFEFGDLKAKFQNGLVLENAIEPTITKRTGIISRSMTSGATRQSSPNSSSNSTGLLIAHGPTNHPISYPNYNDLQNTLNRPSPNSYSRSSPTTPIIEKPNPFHEDENDDLGNNSKGWVDVTDYDYEEMNHIPANGKAHKIISQPIGIKKSASKLNPTRWGRSMSQGHAQSSKKNACSNSPIHTPIPEKLEGIEIRLSGSPTSMTQTSDIDSSSSSSESIEAKPDRLVRPSLAPRPFTQPSGIGAIDFNIRRSYSENSEYSTETSSSITLFEEDEITKQQKRRRRLRNSIRELVDTEKVFLADMQLLEKIYYTQAKEIPIFNPYDLKTVFGNLHDVIEFSSDFLELLYVHAGCGADDGDDGGDVYDVEKHLIDENDQTSIGEAFLLMLDNTKTPDNGNRMESIYGEYCKRREASVAKLQEFEINEDVQSFLQKCKEMCEGQTKSWDIASLLIKPVQRVLKYPLLLHQIYTLTKPTHPDFENLKIAVKKLSDVRKRRMQIHGITKSFTRRAMTIKQATGITKATEDQFYDAYVRKFKKWEQNGQQLLKVIRDWVKEVKKFLEDQERLAGSIVEFYLMDDKKFQDHRSVEYRRIMENLATCRKEMEEALKDNLYPRIGLFMERFEAPAAVMRKRDRKILDYDRARAIKARGDTPDKTLQQSADAFESIRDQLQEELPLFFELMTRFFDAILSEFSAIQTKFYHQMTMEFNQFFYKFIDPEGLEYISDDRHLVLREFDIPTEYTDAILKIDDHMSSFTIMRNGGVFPSPDIGPTGKSRGRSSSVSEPYSLGSSESSRHPGSTLNRSASQDNRRAIMHEEHGFNHSQRMSYHSNSSLSDDIRNTWNLDGTYPFIDENGDDLFNFGNGRIHHEPERISTHRKYATDSVLTSGLQSQTTAVEYDHDYEFNGNGNEDEDDDEVFHDSLTGEENQEDSRVLFMCAAVYSCKPKNPHELSFDRNGLLQVIHIHDDDKNCWWYCVNADTGKRGWVDPAFCEKLD
ncbi:hypothetical protein G9A89_022744 [Geosiphon pyriformis]|nr:hypothetical protein G9A89_022744 [Geosiphon pyriformis]